MKKLLFWIMANGATLIGSLQAIVKALKELLTGIVNLISLFMSKEAAEKAVALVRGIMNKVDDILEKVKGYFLK